MAHQSNHSEMPPTDRGKRRVTGVSSRTSAAPEVEIYPVGFYSRGRDDSAEEVLRVALESAGNFVWRRLQSPADTQDLLKSGSDSTALRLIAVIVVIGTAELGVV